MCAIKWARDFADCSHAGCSARSRLLWVYQTDLGDEKEVTDMDKHDDHDIHTYEYSGIQERTGKVNGWLVIVYVSLLIWGAGIWLRSGSIPEWY